ncbi:hypothetical protein [Terricaulis sp.]|uniref:hypothetical protein n=1 Tax=Terricaulis sp. TaxID=2768686 RepID=UPI002AC750DD|nr:hypothetical protein [Terricaulis sp.]MDZ4690897.1 hypothetical protein [Terricaulis sp.]
MLRTLILASLLALAACAAPAAGPVVHLPVLDADLACNAGDVRTCPAGGCTAANRGEQSTLYIALEVPARGGAGRFCIATGCENATYAPRATNAGFGYTMRTNDRTNYTAELEISSDARSFTLSEGNSEGMNTWTGTCSAAGS